MVKKPAAVLVAMSVATAVAVWWRRRRAARPVPPPVDVAALIHEPSQPATLTRLADGRLRIHWPTPAETAALYAGAPAAAPAGPPLAAARQTTELLFDDPCPGRRSIYTLVLDGVDGRRILPVAERFLPLAGAGNFRDLGGYETEDGAIVRHGRIFRSGDLSRLSAADLAYLEGLPLRAVADLRSARERDNEPDRLPSGAVYHALPVYENAPRGAFLRTMFFERDRLGQVMAESYPRMLAEGAPSYGRLLRLIADDPQSPLVFHCSAGKDRAGIAAALLLSLLRVPRETIIADYSLSNHNFEAIQAELAENDNLARLRISPAELQAVSVADPAWLRELLETIDEAYGGVEGYLRGPAGLDEQTLQRLRAALLA